ncbi:MGDG synthase family glycosyltransferase [Actinomycetospora sp. CA-053990]|uniref:MGDG synthase family glycosyltransferase n=1 Tax=Actinomycetospora sp. CA-053990 TaxID=3239891 RepID=UPI003D8FFD78
MSVITSAEFTHRRRRLAPVPTASRTVRRPAPRGRVLVVSASVGQGHEGAARELARRLTGRDLEVEVVDYLDTLPWTVRHALRDLYAPAVQYTPALFEWMFQRLEHRGGLRNVAQWVIRAAEDGVAYAARDADVVVATYPLAGQTFGRLRDAGRLSATAITYLTDPAAHALWCHPSVDTHLTATRATALDATRYGVAAVSAGPLCSPRFARPVQGRRALRAELGLPDTVPVVLLSAGSLGMGAVPETVTAVLAHPTARVVVLCGRNESLRRRLAAVARVIALGWRDDVADLMSGADVLIHNAGGLSFTEALVAGLPAVTFLPIPGHGRANAAVLEDAGIAPWPRSTPDLVAAIERIHRTPRTARRPWFEGADAAQVVAHAVSAHHPELQLVSGF